MAKTKHRSWFQGAIEKTSVDVEIGEKWKKGGEGVKGMSGKGSSGKATLVEKEMLGI